MLNFTCKNASGSFDWIVDGVDKSMIEQSMVSDWADEIVSQSIEQAFISIEERAEKMSFPIMGYTTSDIYQDADDYISQKKEEAVSEIRSERSEIIQYLNEWLSA